MQIATCTNNKERHNLYPSQGSNLQLTGHINEAQLNRIHKSYTQKQSYGGKMYQKEKNRSFTNADR